MARNRLAQYVDTALAYKGLTRRDLAEGLGTSPAGISKLLNGDERKMTMEIAGQIADFCGGVGDPAPGDIWQWRQEDARLAPGSFEEMFGRR